MSSLFLTSYIALWAIVVVQFIGLFALYRHFGAMYLGTRQGRASLGPAIGERLVMQSATTIDGSLVRTVLSGQESVIVFVSTKCEPCEKLILALPEFALANPEIRIAVISKGSLAETRAWTEVLTNVIAIVPDPGGRLGAGLNIGVTPYAVGLDETGLVRAKGVVNDGDGLREMMDIVSRDTAWAGSNGKDGK